MKWLIITHLVRTRWNEVIISDITKMYIRIALTDTTQSVEEIVIKFCKLGGKGHGFKRTYKNRIDKC